MSCVKTLTVSLSLAVLLAGCRKGQDASDDRVVAKVGDGRITAKDLEEKLAEQPPFIRSRYTTLEQKKEFVENLVRFELLVQEARKQKLDQDPEVRATLEKLMVQKLMRQQAERPTATSAPTGEELEAFYREHQSEFVRPERVRVSQVFLASAKADPKHAQVKAEADRLFAQTKKEEAGTHKSAVAELARSRSDDPQTKSLGGDLGYKTREELASQWGPELAEAAFSLKSMGDLVEVATDRGFHLLKLTGRQPGLDQKLDDVRPRIESRVAMEKRAQSTDDFVKGLRKNANVEIDDKLLSGFDFAKLGEASPGAAATIRQPLIDRSSAAPSGIDEETLSRARSAGGSSAPRPAFDARIPPCPARARTPPTATTRSGSRGPGRTT